MGCGRQDAYDRDQEERNKERIAGFKAIAANDSKILRFIDQLEDINRQLHNFQGCDIPLKRSNYVQINTALATVQNLMRIVTTTRPSPEVEGWREE